MTAKIKKFITNNWHILLPGLVFLVFQTYINFLLWDRQGNIPPSFGDSLGYIFGIKKIIKYHHIFPQIPYFAPSAHFTYLGYNLLLATFGVILNISAQQIFYYSFFAGKIFLLASCIFMLKRIFHQQKSKIALSLLMLGLFVGDGSIHGFFWVVPSFFLLITFFTLIGIALSKGKINKFLLFFFSIFYISIHPMAPFTTPIFISMAILNHFFDKKLSKKFATISIILAISTIVWEILILQAPKFSQQKIVYSTAQESINRVIESLTLNQKAIIIGPDESTPQIINTTPNISVTYFDTILKKHQQQIHKKLPSFIISWNSFFSWFFRFPPLSLISLFGLYIHLKKKKYILLSLFLTSLAASLASLKHPVGFRSLILLFPITIIFLSSSCIEFYKIISGIKPKIKPIINATFTLIISIGLIALGSYGIISVKYYSTIADYQVDHSTCLNFIKDLPPEKTHLVFTSVEGISYFLNLDLEKYLIMGINNFKGHYYKKNLILVTENYEQLNPDDIDMPLEKINDSLEKIMKTSKEVNKYDCGIFQLIHSIPGTLDSNTP